MNLVTARCLTASDRYDADTEDFIVAPTLKAATGKGGNLAAGVRRLTPVECERLMSWPDGWTAPEGVKAPDSRRYAACGDGVVANVAEWIGRGILAEEERHGS